MRMTLSARLLVGPLASILMLAPQVRAEVQSYGVDVGIGNSDNITLVPTGRISETIAESDFDIALRQQSRRFDADLNGNFSYLDYLQHTYSSQFIGRFDGLMHLALVPERLTWMLQENFGQAQLDPFAALTPINRENVNYLSTGPDLALHIGSAGFINVSAHYARAQYEVSPFNSNRVLGSLSLGRQLSAQSNVSLNGDGERVLFDNTVLNTDYDRSSVFGRYELRGSRSQLTASLGATVVSQRGASTSGPLARIELTRKLSSAANLTLSAGQELTDALSSFSTLQSGAIAAISTAPAAVTSHSYTDRYASVGWDYFRNLTSIALSGRWEKDSYRGQPQLDVTRSDAEISAERLLTRTLSAQLLGSLYRTDYANVSFTAKDVRIGAGLKLRVGRGLEVRLRYDHISRSASDVGGGYRENRAFLSIGYRPR
jgi:hypothetical protein